RQAGDPAREFREPSDPLLLEHRAARRVDVERQLAHRRLAPGRGDDDLLAHAVLSRRLVHDRRCADRGGDGRSQRLAPAHEARNGTTFVSHVDPPEPQISGSAVYHTSRERNKQTRHALAVDRKSTRLNSSHVKISYAV